MPEWTTFVQAIRNEYHSDEPRLICADWLEENGNLPRADFIRLSCQELNPEMHPDRVVEFRKRAYALQEKHHEQWLASIPPKIREIPDTPTWYAIGPNFVRGMVDLSISPRAFLSKKVQKSHEWLLDAGVVGVTFDGGTQSATAMASPALEGIPAIRSRDCPITDEQIEIVTQAPHLHNLQELRLGQTRIAQRVWEQLEMLRTGKSWFHSVSLPMLTLGI